MGRDSFDFMRDFSLQLPVQVIGMLVGVPKKDQADLLAIFQKNLHEPDPDKALIDGILESAAWFNDYLDWREKNPVDDIMSQLMKFEFEDYETGEQRVLRRDEIVTYLTLITTAGSDTTATVISWAGDLLSRNPDQRAELVADPALIPQAVEEVLRCEPPSYHFCRWSTKDTEFHGQVIPAESIVVVIPPTTTATSGCARTPTSSTSTASRSSTSRSASARTTAWAPTWPASRPASRWRRSCRGSRSGRATSRRHPHHRLRHPRLVEPARLHSLSQPGREISRGFHRDRHLHAAGARPRHATERDGGVAAVDVEGLAGHVPVHVGHEVEHPVADVDGVDAHDRQRVVELARHELGLSGGPLHVALARRGASRW